QRHSVPCTWCGTGSVRLCTFFFQAEDGIRGLIVTGVQTCALPISISGVQRAEILGDRTFAMRVWLKPDKMAAAGISPTQVRDARSEERRVGKEWRSGRSTEAQKKKMRDVAVAGWSDEERVPQVLRQ